MVADVPEGHILHRLARQHTRDLAGRPVTATTGQSRFAAGARRLDGQTLRRADAWGKHLFHDYDGGDVLHVHLGLIGLFTRRHIDEAPSDTVRLRLSVDDVAWDLTGPMICTLITPDEKTAVTAKLGPDPLRRNADPERFRRSLARSRRPVGVLLLDQTVIAGIGNVYRSEILNIVGIDPRRPANSITDREADEIWAETVRQLRLGARRGQIVTMDRSEHRKPLDELDHLEALYVYKKDRCGRCGDELDVYELAGRTTWSCPRCQPDAPDGPDGNGGALSRSAASRRRGAEPAP